MGDFHLTSSNDGTFLIRLIAKVRSGGIRMDKEVYRRQYGKRLCVILTKNQKVVCDEIRKNNFDFSN